jgi:copper chaperone
LFQKRRRKMSNVMIKVKGMTCEHCQAAVEGALGGIEGVAASKVDLAGGTANVDYDEALASVKDFEAAVEEAGFEVE